MISKSVSDNQNFTRSQGVGGGPEKQGLFKPKKVISSQTKTLSNPSQMKPLRKYTNSLSDTRDSFIAGGGFGQQLI